MIGIEDENFIRGNVPMTKQEIRILTIAKAQICAKDCIADIGAGTGSLSIEAAQIAVKGYVFAIDKNPDAIELITQNAEKFSADNVIIVHAEAPAGLKQIPKIDVAFIGGSGGNLIEILNTIDEKLKAGGRIVANFITIQSLATCVNWIHTHKNYTYDIMQVQITRYKNVGDIDMAQANNPVHIVMAKKIIRKQAINVIKLPVESEKAKVTISALKTN